jgi:hypothetical protein
VREAHRKQRQYPLLAAGSLFPEEAEELARSLEEVSEKLDA